MLERLKKYRDHLHGYVELRHQNNYANSLVMQKGNLIHNNTSRIGGVSARSYKAGTFGFSSTPDASELGVLRVLKESRDNAELFHRFSKRDHPPLPERAPGTGIYDYRGDFEPWSAAQRVEVLKCLNAYLEEKYPTLLTRNITLQSLAMEKALITSVGAETYSYVPRVVLHVRLATLYKGDIVELGQSFGGFGGFERHFSDISTFYPALDTLHDELERKARGVYCKPGVHDVILHPSMAGILAHEAIGHTCEADCVLGGSIAGKFVGEQVASEKLTLIDHMARAPDGQGSIAIHVDDEGTPCEDVTIIKDGILTGLLHSKETARIMDVTPTGNARAFLYSDEPLVRMRNTAITPGDDNLEDMISGIDDGYLLTRPKNGQADSTSEFMFGVGYGYEIKNGKLGAAIRDTTVSGIAFDMLKTVTQVSEDMSWSRGGMCGKKQPIPVGMGGPAIRCQINIGGR